MKRTLRLAVPVLAVAFCAGLIPSPGAGDGEGALVDYRATPLEQVRKIHDMTVARKGEGVTMTVMVANETGDRHHVIVDRATATPDYIRDTLATGVVDSITWTGPGNEERGACDSDAECQAKTSQMCETSGHGSVMELTIRITTNADGTRTCSGDCENNGAIAFVTCNLANCLLCG